MLKRILNKKAQAVMGEYVLTFFLVIGVMSAMTIYLKRGLQGRVRDARVEMENIVLSRVGSQYTRNFSAYYEPYYINTVTTVNRSQASTKGLLPSAGFSSGISDQTFNEKTTIQSISNVIPPRLADY